MIVLIDVLNFLKPDRYLIKTAAFYTSTRQLQAFVKYFKYYCLAVRCHLQYILNNLKYVESIHADNTRQMRTLFM